MIKIRNLYAYPKQMPDILSELNLNSISIKVIKLSHFLTNKITYEEIASHNTNRPFSIDYDVPLTETSLNGFLQMTFYPKFSKVTFITNKTSQFNIKNKLQEESTNQGYFDFTFFEPDISVPLSIGDFNCNLIPTADSNEFDLLIPEETKINIKYIKLLTDEVRLPQQENEKLPSADILTHELLNTKRELENHKTYLQIAINQQETNKILEFYHAQYEVLPLWYKQFGHVIKIFTGNRKIFKK